MRLVAISVFSALLAAQALTGCDLRGGLLPEPANTNPAPTATGESVSGAPGATPSSRVNTSPSPSASPAPDASGGPDEGATPVPEPDLGIPEHPLPTPSSVAPGRPPENPLPVSELSVAAEAAALSQEIKAAADALKSDETFVAIAYRYLAEHPSGPKLPGDSAEEKAFAWRTLTNRAEVFILFGHAFDYALKRREKDPAEFAEALASGGVRDLATHLVSFAFAGEMLILAPSCSARFTDAVLKAHDPAKMLEDFRAYFLFAFKTRPASAGARDRSIAYAVAKTGLSWTPTECLSALLLTNLQKRLDLTRSKRPGLLEYRLNFCPRQRHASCLRDDS